MPRLSTCQPKPVRGLGAVVGLDDLDLEREPLRDVVYERDCCALVGLGVDAQHPQPGAVVDGGELVVPLGRDPVDGSDEPDVDLHPVARPLFLVALRALGAALVALVRRQPAEPQPVQDAPHP